VHEGKKRKYANLAEELSRQRQEEIRVTAVIMSSMCAVYLQSLKDLEKILRCSDQEMRNLRRKMSETVIAGSMKIWWTNAEAIESGTEEKANRMITMEIEEMNQEVSEFEDGLENQIDKSKEGNETEGVIEEPKQNDEEHELGLVVEVGMEEVEVEVEVEVGVDDRIDEEQRVLDSEERQMEDHRMDDPEELEIERRD
jgi:hypothetical protein